MATTTPDNLWSPDLGTTFVPTTDLAHMQDTVQAALSARVSTYQVDTNAVRLAFPAPFEGLRWRTSDTRIDWIYTAGSWVTIEQAATVVRPTSVVGGAIQSDGSVNFTAVATVSLNGVFTSRFRSYEVQYRTSTKGTGAGISIRLRNGSTDNTASSYLWRRSGSTGTGYSELSQTSNAFEPDFQGFQIIVKSINLLQPNLAAFTSVWSTGGMESNGSSGLTTMFGFSGQHQVASAFDGITFFMAAGTMTGNVVVIGHP